MEVIKAIIELLVGLVVFIIGMNMMSSGLKKSAGRNIKTLIKKLRNNRFANIGIGTLVTAIIQSSSATSVMVIGFINAGIMTIFQGLSIMLGAYIGTTMTGLIVSLSAFSFSSFLMVFAFIGFVLSFNKNQKIKHISEILIGFGILFFGLEAMSSAFQVEQIRNATVSFVSSVSFPLLLVIIGAILTSITQSSSATNGIVIVMVYNNPQLLSSGMYLVLGATIGAVVPTLLASIGGNIDSKRTAIGVLLIRSVSALVGLIFLWIFNAPIMNLFTSIFTVSQYGLAIAIFTIIYNIIDVLIVAPLIGVVAKLLIKLIKDKKALEQKKALKYIDDRFLNTPSIAMMQVKNEIKNMHILALENYKRGYDMVLNQTIEQEKMVAEVEDKIDYINNAVTNYLIKLSNHVDLIEEKRIGAYFHVINDIERIGDHAYNFSGMAKKMNDDGIAFTETEKAEFGDFNSLLIEMFNLSLEIFSHPDKDKLNKLHNIEDQTDDLKLNLTTLNFESLKKNEERVELSPYFTTFVSELERIADHLTNIGYSTINPTGDEKIYFNK